MCTVRSVSCDTKGLVQLDVPDQFINCHWYIHILVEIHLKKLFLQWHVLASLFRNFLPRLTVLLGLEGDLSALFLPLWVGQWQTDMDAVVGWQITQREARGVVLHCQALAHGGVVAPAASRCGVAVTQGHWVGVAACQVERQVLPLQGQLPGLDICGHEAPQWTHRLWEGGRLKTEETIE